MNSLLSFGEYFLKIRIKKKNHFVLVCVLDCKYSSKNYQYTLLIRKGLYVDKKIWLDGCTHCGPKKHFTQMRVQGQGHRLFCRASDAALGFTWAGFDSVGNLKTVPGGIFLPSSLSWFVVLIHCNPEINISYREKMRRERCLSGCSEA